MPPMQPHEIAEVQKEIESLERLRRNLRAQERGLQAREQALRSEPMVKQENLRENLEKFLPPHLMPGNVGGLNTVAWPFWFQVGFDFGTNPTITANTRQTQSYQITQEAAFLLLAVSRQANAYGTSGHLGPYTVEIRDRQSSRQFNDRPVPIQMISAKPGRPTRLPTAMLLMPNAFIDVTMASWLTGALSQATVGSGVHQFSFFGYRVRIEDTEKVLSSVFR